MGDRGGRGGFSDVAGDRIKTHFQDSRTTRVAVKTDYAETLTYSRIAISINAMFSCSKSHAVCDLGCGTRATLPSSAMHKNQDINTRIHTDS